MVLGHPYKDPSSAGHLLLGSFTLHASEVLAPARVAAGRCYAGAPQEAGSFDAATLHLPGNVAPFPTIDVLGDGELAGSRPPLCCSFARTRGRAQRRSRLSSRRSPRSSRRSSRRS